MSVNVFTPSSYNNVIQSGNLFNASTNPLGYIEHSEITKDSSSPDEGLGQDGPSTATRTLRCRWQDRYTLARQLLGGPLIIGSLPNNPTAAQINAKYSISSSTNDIFVWSPHRHPYFPYLYAKNLKMRPENGNGTKGGAANAAVDTNAPAETIVNFEFAILTVDYVAPQAQTASCLGTFMEESITPKTEFLTLPNNTLYWDTGRTQPIDAGEAPAMQIKKLTWSVKRRKIPLAGLVLPSVIGLQNYVNSDTPQSLILLTSFAGGSVLFEGGTVSPDILTDGNPGVQIEMHFTVMVGLNWNKFPHVAAQATPLKFDPIYNNSGTQFAPWSTGALSALVSLASW